MRISLNTSKWYDNIWAAMIFFTRLPLWRVYQPPRESYRAVVEYWPLAGWLTGGVMAGTMYFGSLFLPYPVAIIMAISARMLLTGALHEDGLCDFFDGFGGGGNNRERILAIMKDSRTGTYGVLGIVLYIFLLAAALYSLPPEIATITILAADPYAKMIAGQIIMMMPYARTEEESKAKTVYRRMNVRAATALAVQGLLPLAAYIYIMYGRIDWQLLVFIPCIVMYFLYLMIWNKLRGYTGDCCGALFLLVELSIYIAVAGMI
ncbi:MAG: adenosylcobinamide-GDP ribazoletransferase [Prevotella sp.]|nr:adenosylcobinamide-GDP ribazoletransferase [Prevotella sp.]